jgi:transposase
MQAWFKAQLAKLSRKSDVALAINYALGRWTALVRYCDDGNIEIGRVEMWRGSLGAAYLFPAFRSPVPH